MDHVVGPWKMAHSHGPTSWCDFSKKNQFTKSSGSSLGVNRMWTKKNDYAPKRECAAFFNICSKRAIPKFFLVQPFSCLHILFPKSKNSFKFYHSNISLPRTLAFFSTKAHLLPLPPQNPLNHVNG